VGVAAGLATVPAAAPPPAAAAPPPPPPAARVGVIAPIALAVAPAAVAPALATAPAPVAATEQKMSLLSRFCAMTLAPCLPPSKRRTRK
jgi:hypothetical protein